MGGRITGYEPGAAAPLQGGAAPAAGTSAANPGGPGTPSTDTQSIGAQRIGKGRVTISHLAEALGLTKGTVSRAMNGYPDISDRTRARVMRQAERMGYRPLSHAQAIRTGRVRSIGLVIQTDAHDGQRPFLAEFLAGLTQSASAESWTLTVATARSDGELTATLDRLVDERKADGFILPRTRLEDERVALLRDHDVPFVLYGRTGDPEGCAWYDILGEEAMAQAVMRLAAQGHERIAHVGGGEGYTYARLREEGFIAGMRAAGLAHDPALIRRDAVTRAAGAAATRGLLQQGDPPTAIVFATDMAALGAYDAAQALGLEIGRDLSVMGYDGIPEGQWMRPALTTFSVDTRAAGARLAHLLIERIRGAAPEDLRETARARLSAGGSDGPPRLDSRALAARIKAHGTP